MEMIGEFTRILQTSGSTTDNGSTGETGKSANNTLEFAAFLLFYLALVLCCLVPVYCEYRRRRIVESRLAQHHFDLQQLQQQELNGYPNFSLLDRGTNHQSRANNEEYRRIRSEKIAEMLQATTLVLTDQDFEAQTLENDGASLVIGTDDYLGDVEESTMRVKLPNDAANGDRSVTGLCAICLCPYTSYEKLSWSPKPGCQHAFHQDCIVEWLAKKEELKCPVCRQHYCEPIHMDDSFPLPEEFLEGRFAGALDRARSHAMRWSNIRNSGNRPFFVAFSPQVERVPAVGGRNDPSLRDINEGRSGDIEVGLVVSSELAMTADADGGGEVKTEEVTDFNASNAQLPDTATVANSDEESETEDVCVGEKDAAGQRPETNIDTNHDGGIEIEKVDVSDADIIDGLTEERSRIDS